MRQVLLATGSQFWRGRIFMLTKNTNTKTYENRIKAFIWSRRNW